MYYANALLTYLQRPGRRCGKTLFVTGVYMDHESLRPILLPSLAAPYNQVYCGYTACNPRSPQPQPRVSTKRFVLIFKKTKIVARLARDGLWLILKGETGEDADRT